MTKIEYIKASHAVANRRVREWFEGKRPQNKFAIRLWQVITWVAMAIIIPISWLAFVLTLFERVEFSIHYMEFYIESKGLSQIEANEYLHSKKQEYIRYLSYGVISKKSQQKIDSTFDCLFLTYPTPHPEVVDNKHQEIIGNLMGIQGAMVEALDNKHQEVINNFSQVKQSVANVADNTQQLLEDEALGEMQNGIAEIINYNRQAEKNKSKSQQERDEELRVATQRRERTVRRTRFEINPEDLESKLSAEQIVTLLDHINSIKVFVREITLRELEDVLMCIHTEPLQTNHNKILASLLQKMSAHRLISPKWQRVAGNKGCFSSRSGKLLSAKDLSAAKQQAGLIDINKERMIDECIEALT